MVKRDDLLRTYLVRKFKSMTVSAVSPADTPPVFLVGVLSRMRHVMTADLSAHKQQPN
jgi:hypothetical protein